MRNIKSLLLCLQLVGIFLRGTPAYAVQENDSDSSARHYVVAIDVAYAAQDRLDYLARTSTRDMLWRVVESNAREGDYVSVVTYALNCDDPHFDRFVTVARDGKGSELKWQPYSAGMVREWNNWDAIVTGQHMDAVGPGRKASLQSMAKEYVLSAVRLGQAEKNRGISGAAETILLMVTDDIANGVNNSYTHEYGILQSTFTPLRRTRDEVFAYVDQCGRLLSFVPTKLKDVEGRLSGSLDMGHVKLRMLPYKVIPAQQPSIQTATNIPTPLPFMRARGGHSLRLLAEVRSDKYQVYRTAVMSQNRVLSNALGENVEMWVKNSQVKDGDMVRFRLWLKYSDGIYDGIILSPSDPLYGDGLQMEFPFHAQQNAKIFGRIPLVDVFWWWFPSNVLRAVFVWEIIIILILLFLVVLVSYKLYNRITRYVPDNKDIVITKF